MTVTMNRRGFLGGVAALAAPVPSVPIAPVPVPADRRSGWERSEAHERLRLIGALMRLTADLCRHQVDEHPAGCECLYCDSSYPEDLGDLLTHLRGAEYLLTVSAGWVESGVIHAIHNDAASYGADLRELANLSDRIDAMP